MVFECFCVCLLLLLLTVLFQFGLVSWGCARTPVCLILVLGVCVFFFFFFGGGVLEHQFLLQQK